MRVISPVADRHSPFTIRHSLFAIRYSPVAVVLARQEPRLPIFASPLVPRPTTRFKSVSTKTKPAIWVARCGLRVEG
ncbi:MAG: hypothetical protein ACO2PL_06110 [Armatimonadota bacterium]